MEKHLHSSTSPAGAKIFALLIGGTPQIRAGICHAAQDDHFHVEPVASVDELTEADWKRSDVVIAWNDPGAIEDVRARIRDSEHWLPIIACAQRLTTEEVVDTLEAGAIDIIEWPISLETLAHRIQSILRKRTLSIPPWERAFRAQRRLRQLSNREREVIAAVVDGLSNKDIARRLDISHRTVEIHRMNALLRLKVDSTAGAVALVTEASFAQGNQDQPDLFAKRLSV